MKYSFDRTKTDFQELITFETLKGQDLTLIVVTDF